MVRGEVREGTEEGSEDEDAVARVIGGREDDEPPIVVEDEETEGTVCRVSIDWLIA